MSGISRRGFLGAASAMAASTALDPARALASVPTSPTSSRAGGDDAWDEVPRILARIRPPEFPRRDFRITDHGGVGDGKSDAQPAFARAIDACTAAGGGRVVVPAGTWWVAGPIHLKSNVHLHLEEGSTIRFSPEAKHYLPLVLTRWEGTELYNYSPMIYAYQATNVAITGRGTIDGNSKDSFATWKERQEPAQMRLRQMGHDGVPVQQRIFGEGHWLRPSMIQFWGCRNVLVEDLSIVDAPFWIVHPVYCQNVIARGLKITSWNTNNDAVDPDSSVDVLIENCVFNTGDDGVAVKSGRDQDAWRVGQPTENVIVRNCDMNSKANGLVIGSEMSAGVRNVFMENCRIGKVRKGIYFKSNLDRGGLVERIRIRNVSVDDSEIFIFFTTDYHGYRGGNAPTAFRDIVLENITCRETDKGIEAVGVPASPLRDIVLDDITVQQAAIPFEIRHVSNFRLDDVRINGKPVVLPPTIS